MEQIDKLKAQVWLFSSTFIITTSVRWNDRTNRKEAWKNDVYINERIRRGKEEKQRTYAADARILIICLFIYAYKTKISHNKE